MKLDSKYFDCIRVKPDEDRLLRELHPGCEWKGCDNPAPHRAPKGRGREGEYFNFCLEHVRRYNKSYNYFDGMSDEEVAGYQKAAATGHRPTWSMGTRAPGSRRAGQQADFRHFMYSFAVEDGFGLFGEATGRDQAREYTSARPIRNMERKCLTALNLDIDATPGQIKQRYKILVKRLHPDANGGDRRSEDKLREVIQAYNYLKKVGLC
ncbi:MAG: J domain-containing protein [Alphaproteobacteria bacterium]|nr:MAG: J domain-containing protein [Alphaproteobacteria bacterium]